jgi:hypothetical protein
MQYLVGLMVIATIGCASSPVKQSVVLSTQGIQTALGIVQDTERALYQGGTVKGLTPEVHTQISGLLAKAFDDQIKLQQALKQWRVDDPIPASLSALLTDMNQTLAVIFQLLPNAAATDLAKQVLAVLDATTQVMLALGVK